METILVIAGNKAQFDNWLRDFVVAEPGMFTYADAHSLLGRRYSAILKIGTYYEHRDFEDIRNWVHHYFPEINL